MKFSIVKSLAAAALLTLPVMTVHAAGGHNNHAALFLGATDSDAGTDPTVGIEYEYRTPLWDHKIGIGVVAERILGDHEANVFVAGVVVHPWKDLKLNLSAGQESADGHSEDVTRVGVGYDLHYNNISYGPVYNMDSINGHTAHVFGVAVGMGF